MTHSHYCLKTTPYSSCIHLARGHLGNATTMKLFNEKSFVSVERSLKKHWSSWSKPCSALVCVKQGCARRSLFTVSGMSDSAAHSLRRGNGPCSMLMNIHPLNGLCTVLSPPLPHPHTFLPSPCSPLSSI